MLTARLLQSAALLGVVLAGACGGSGDGGARLSRDELAERAGAICARHFAAIERLARGRTRDLDSARFLSEVGERFRELAVDLSELEPPEDLEARFRSTVVNIGRLGDDLDRAAKRARSGDAQGMNTILQAANNPAIERFFREQGIAECTS